VRYHAIVFPSCERFDEIPDTDGFEFKDSNDLRTQILKPLEEIRKEKPHRLEDGKGWRVNVADDSGQVFSRLRWMTSPTGSGFFTESAYLILKGSLPRTFLEPSARKRSRGFLLDAWTFSRT
jgi:hypothetical protein